MSGPDLGRWLARPDGRRFRLFAPPFTSTDPDEARRKVEARLAALGMPPEELAALGLPASFPPAPPPPPYAFLVSATLLRPHELPAGVLDPDEYGRPDFDEGVDAPALLRPDEAERLVCEHGLALISDAEWLAMADPSGSLSWWCDAPWDAERDPTPFESPFGIRDLAFGEYVGAAGGLAGIRGGGALTWPWQHPAEWVQTVTAVRVPLDRSLGFAGVREVIRVPA